MLFGFGATSATGVLEVNRNRRPRPRLRTVAPQWSLALTAMTSFSWQEILPFLGCEDLQVSQAELPR
jgi:hypothetical protein